MKKIAFVALLLTTQVFANEEKSSQPAVFMGSMSLENQKYTDLTIKGEATLKTIEAKTITLYGQSQMDGIKAQKLMSYGPLSISNSQLTDIHVNGPAEIAGTTVLGSVQIAGPALTYSSKFKGAVQIEGDLECFGSAFEKLLTLRGQNSQFKEVAIKKIKVLKPSQQNLTPQTIVLIGVDVAYIEFESGKGVVKADKKSTIGKIVGGKIIRE